ncbi:MAG: CoA transferase [Actinobacteria bacterium]|nr:CoA transferase [Actinomycetota bacterium]
MPGPLEGLKVADFTRMLPGPFCTHLLADMGADVIKVEDAGNGDPMRLLPPFLPSGMSTSFLNINKNKRGIAVDFKSEGRLEVFSRLAMWADVIVEQYRPGVMDMIGLSYDMAFKINERVIYCSITGYGQDGPYRDFAGHDLNFMACSGLLRALAPPGSPPSVCPVQISDLAAGGMMGVASILAADYEMKRTGRGSHVDVSMLDGTVSMLALNLGELCGTFEGQVDSNLFLSGGVPWYNVYSTADGHIAVGTIENKFWLRLCELLGRPEYGEKQYGKESFEEITGWLKSVFREKTTSAWVDFFRGEDVCVSPVNSIGDIMEDPQVNARGMIFASNYENIGEVVVTGTPFNNGEKRAEKGFPAPFLGQHTEEVLGMLGFGTDKIGELESSGAVLQGR